MCKLVDKYSSRKPEEWGPLFHTILQRMIVDWYRRNAVRERFRGWFGHHHDDENQECISCESENIEHINKSIRDWKEKQANNKRKIDIEEYCICPNCNYEELHKRGVPCFALACPDCKTPLRRKGI